MNPALWAAKTGLDAQQTRLAVTSNNLANVSTSGFKKSRAVFEDLLYQNVRQVGASTSQDTQAPSGVHLGTGVRVVATEKIYTQGGLHADRQRARRGHRRPRLLPDPDARWHHRATRAMAASSCRAQGQMVTSSGYVLQPGITIPDGSQSITIGRDGVVTVRVAGQADAGAGRTAAAHGFRESRRPAAARRKPAWRKPRPAVPRRPARPARTASARSRRARVEASNVNVVEELVNMIETQRAYEMNSKAISTADQMLEYVNQQL